MFEYPQEQGVQLRTGIHYAAKCGFDGVIEVLLTDDIEVDERNSIGETPLHTASRYGQLDVVHCLIDAGADTNPKDIFGRTPLHHAAFYGHLEIVQFLIKDYAEGHTPDETVAYINTPDGGNYTPAVLATLSFNQNIISFLHSLGARLPFTKESSDFDSQFAPARIENNNSILRQFDATRNLQINTRKSSSAALQNFSEADRPLKRIRT